MKKLIRIVAFITFCFFTCNSILAQNKITIKDWMISNQGQKDISNIDGITDWVPLTDANRIKDGAVVGNSRYNWIKGCIVVGDKFPDICGLIFPNIYMYNRVYINGQFVGELTEKQFKNFSKSKSYFIDPSILQEGENLILIQLGYYKNWYGVLDTNLLLLSKYRFLNEYGRMKISENIMLVAIYILRIAIMLSLFIRFIYYKRKLSYLLCFLMSLIHFPIYFSPVKLFLDIPHVIVQWLASWLFLFYIIFIYNQSEYQKVNRKYNLILFGLFFIFLGMLFTIRNAFAFYHILVPFTVLLIISAASLNIVHLILLNKESPNKIKLMHLIINCLSFFILFILILMHILMGSKIGFDPRYTVAPLSLVLLINYFIYNTRLDHQDEKELIKLKEVLVKKTEKEDVYSDDIVLRIESSIKYINENYSKSISRDDLAQSVGLTGSYFSTIFNSYTGESISSYINKVRCEAARDEILNSKTSIINIAFNSGFESLSTFNRAFKKFFGKSPSEFRQAS